MSERKKKRNVNALKPGATLHGYEIKATLGQGSFGISYLAEDKNRAQEVVIKEYLPAGLATRSEAQQAVSPLSHEVKVRYYWGLAHFLKEARTLGQCEHANIVKVRQVFKDNNSAYMVMDYESGESLQDILSRRKFLDEEDILAIIHPLIDGLKHAHAHGCIHCDIKPANIFIRVDGDPVLLDFGAARLALDEDRQSLSSIFSKGYAPIEQYKTKDEQQGPWTDIYAVSATLYRAVAGIPPSDAVDRSSAISLAAADTYVDAVEIAAGKYSKALLEAIDHGMQFAPHERPQTVSEWQVMFPRAGADTGNTADSPGGDTELQQLINKATDGDLASQASLADCYAKGVNVEKNEHQALHWYKIAAEQDHVNAQFNLAVMYFHGKGTEQDSNQSRFWYRKAALHGDVSSMATLANMSLQGVGTEKDDKAAFDWFYRAAKLGHLNSIFSVAEMYANGAGVQINRPEAGKWYKKAAQKGHVTAQIKLGYLYGKGDGIERDDKESLRWYTKAAKAGNINAQYNLGLIYAKGRGAITQDIETAKKWFQAAADQGMTKAKQSLAKINP